MQCVVCSSPHTIESHHMRLQAEGGESSTEVPLCATCHKLAHLQARALQSKSTKTREKNYIPSTLAKKMGIDVQAILSGALKFEIEKEKFQNVAMQNIQIPVSPNQLARLHILKKHYNHSSLEAFLMQVITKLTNLQATAKDGNS